MNILFLDDQYERFTMFHANWPNAIIVWSVTATEAIDSLKTGGPFDLVMLDHDLEPEHYDLGAFNTGTGQEVAQWISQHLELFPDTLFVCHSLNPVGRARMFESLQGCNRMDQPWGWFRMTPEVYRKIVEVIHDDDQNRV